MIVYQIVQNIIIQLAALDGKVDSVVDREKRLNTLQHFLNLSSEGLYNIGNIS
jgi:hypothetical protein